MIATYVIFSAHSGLGVSEGQGDYWSNVTCVLPPTYAVRFM